MTALVMLAAVILMTAVIISGSGWAIAGLWNWLAPLFWKGAPHLTFLQGIGVFALIALIGGIGTRK